MAIEMISSTPAYQTAAVSQTAAVTPASKTSSEYVTREGDTLENISLRPDTKTVAVDKTHETADDGQQSGGNNTSTQSEESLANEHERLRKAVEDMNKKMNNSVAKFGIHEETNRITIKIVDKDTDKVIKEFPPEKTLDMIAKAWELAGILVDEKR